MRIRGDPNTPLFTKQPIFVTTITNFHNLTFLKKMGFIDAVVRLSWRCEGNAVWRFPKPKVIGNRSQGRGARRTREKKKKEEVVLVERESLKSTSFTSSCRIRLSGIIASASFTTPLWLSSLTNTPTPPLMAKPALAHPALTDHPKIVFATKETDLLQWEGDILVVGVTEMDVAMDANLKLQNPVLEKLDSVSGGLLSKVSIDQNFTAKAGQYMVISVPNIGAKQVRLIGLGEATSASVFCDFGKSVALAAKASQAKHVGITLAYAEGLTPELKLATISEIAKGTLMGTYGDNRFKSESKKPSLKFVDFLGFGSGPELEEKLKYTEDFYSGVVLGKELTNAPANVLTAMVLAKEAEKSVAASSDVYKARILDTKKSKELKMGSDLGVAVAVAVAFANPPSLIHLYYKPPSGFIKTKLVLVGKGSTFECGGCNIKTSTGCSLELMKFGMGGSAAVLGAAKAVGLIKPSGVEVHFIVAACENIKGGAGMRPGDILTASNGKTIEIVDLATLNGACIVALGHSIAGIYTPSDELSNEVVAASEVAGEKLWRLPMEETYWESMKLIGSHEGGSIKTVLFLNQCVDVDKVQWLHIDMTGPVWKGKEKAATGFGVHTLIERVMSNSSTY